MYTKLTHIFEHTMKKIETKPELEEQVNRITEFDWKKLYKKWLKKWRLETVNHTNVENAKNIHMIQQKLVQKIIEL